MGHNHTVSLCGISRRTGHAPGSASADRPCTLLMTTDDDDRQQRAKQY